MNLSALKAPRPIPPRLSMGDKKAQTFLRDLEKIKTSKRSRKQLKRCNELIHRIVQTLRKSDSDHILYTTCIWTLITMFRLFPEPIKEMMLIAGVPGVLHEVLATGMMTGSMRQYTSELCYFLSSNQPYPDAEQIPKTGPMVKLPEVSAANKYQGHLDDVSVADSDVSSEVFAGARDSKHPFVPYRISGPNLAKLEALFNQGYEEQIAETLPNPDLLSNFGFAGHNNRQGEWAYVADNADDDDDDSDDDEDEEGLYGPGAGGGGDESSVNSTISSGSAASSLAYSIGSVGSISVMSANGSNGRGGGGGGGGLSTFQSLQKQHQLGMALGSGIHNRSYARGGGSSGIGFGNASTSTSGIGADMGAGGVDFARWHEQQPPHANPFVEDASPLTTHYRDKEISSARQRSAHFRIGGFGHVGPGGGAAAGVTLSVQGGGSHMSGASAGIDGLHLSSHSLTADHHNQQGSRSSHDFFGNDHSLTTIGTGVGAGAGGGQGEAEQEHEEQSPRRRLRAAGIATAPTASDLAVDSWYTQKHPQQQEQQQNSRSSSSLREARYVRQQRKQEEKQRQNVEHQGLQVEMNVPDPEGGFKTPFHLLERSIADSQYGGRYAERDALLPPRHGADGRGGSSGNGISAAGNNSGGSPSSALRVRTANALPTFTGAVFGSAGGGGGAVGRKNLRQQADFGSLPATAPDSSAVGGGGGAKRRSQQLHEQQLQGSKVEQLLSQLDPLSLSLNIATKGKRQRRSNTAGNHPSLMDGDEVSKVGGPKGEEDVLSHTGSWLSDEYDEDGTAGGEGYGDNDDDFSDTSMSISDAGFFDSNMVDAPGSKFNQFVFKKKQRIRAEKLVDHTFTKRLFAKHATTAQAQSLISRLESLFQLMDKDDSGFVTWETFARLVLAVAPSHLLRADVMAFMSAQTENDQNLIDYREFIISGKVMVIDKQKSTKDFMPTAGWLNRQRLYAGEESTYTWQNHVKWYQSRRSKAVVWLMRRATRSLKHSVLLEEAQDYLLKCSKRGVAMTWLLEVGYTAVHSQDVWIDAKRKLLTRAMHARRWAQTVDLAQVWLSNTARGVVEKLRREEELALAVDPEALAAQRAAEELDAQPRKKQADYATFYKMFTYYNLSFQWLKTRAEAAKVHSDKQDQQYLLLKTHAYKMLMHQMYTESAASWLRMAGENAYRYCMDRDDVMKYLFRRGQHALAYMIRQEKALAWCMDRSDQAQQFMARKDATLESLQSTGRFTLKFLNAREEAFAGLVVRRNRAAILVERKIAAFKYLSEQTVGMWDHIDRQNRTQEYLAQRARDAMVHLVRRAKAYQHLRHLAGKASTVLRRTNIAFTDLMQIGQKAKIVRFKEMLKTVPLYARRVANELKLVKKQDEDAAASRKGMSKVERWRTELEEAFDWIAVTITPAAYQGGQRKLIGRVGFSMLLAHGKLLGGAVGGVAAAAVASALNYTAGAAAGTDSRPGSSASASAIDGRGLNGVRGGEGGGGRPNSRSAGKLLSTTGAAGGILAAGFASGSIDEHFKTIDSATACFVSFDAVWMWFLFQAEQIEAANAAAAAAAGKRPPPPLSFTCAKDILPAQERAIITTLKRINSEKFELSSSLDWDALEEARRKAEEEESSEEEEEDPLENIDDDTLFNDPKYAHLVQADIGRLMKYLTKRRQMKEKAAREAKARAEALAKAEAERQAAAEAAQQAALAEGSALLGAGSPPRSRKMKKKAVVFEDKEGAAADKQTQQQEDGSATAAAAATAEVDDGKPLSLGDFLDEEEEEEEEEGREDGEKGPGPPPLAEYELNSPFSDTNKAMAAIARKKTFNLFDSDDDDDDDGGGGNGDKNSERGRGLKKQL